MSINDVSRADLREDARRAIENLEIWLRRWIDTTMRAAFGGAYFDHVDRGNRVVKKEIVDKLRQQVVRDPERYTREVDAILLSDAISITCHPQCFHLFSPVYSHLFPQATAQTVKSLMDRIVPIRNPASHANEISLREVLLVVSMSTEIVEAIKKQFEAQNQGREFNVPSLIKVSDSFGRVWHSGQKSPPARTVYPGDTVTVYAEVDPSFDPGSYKIIWAPNRHETRPTSETGPQFTYTFQIADVGETFSMICVVVQSKPWHRHRSYDDHHYFTFRVLPPPGNEQLLPLPV